MPCSGRYASAADFATLWHCGGPLTAAEQAAIEAALDLTVSDIHAVLAAQDACDCTYAGWATELLKKLNVVEAALLMNCTCGGARLNDTQRQMYMNWLNTQLELIRTGKLDVCNGHTGNEYPALGWAEIAWTDENAAQIIYNRTRREG
jgi:hypothetical protein